MTAENSSRQNAPDHRPSVSFSDASSSSAIPAKRRGVAMVKPSKKAKSEVDHSSLPASKRPSIDGNGIAHSPRPRGSGIYKTGTWEYAPDEDMGAEKMTKVVNEISATIEAAGQKPAKVTRHSYSKMKSSLVGRSAVSTPSQEPPPATEPIAVNSTPTRPLPEQSVRRSSRARNDIDYGFRPIEIDEDQSDIEVAKSPTRSKRQKLPSKDKSLSSHDSTPSQNQPTQSTSVSPVEQRHADPGQSGGVKPKMTWTAIVYDILGSAKTPNLTLVEIGEAIKEKYPYFRSPVHEQTLKSSPRNPLYAHPAFRQVHRLDGKHAWAIHPGNFYDKKTKKLLTAGSPSNETIHVMEPSNSHMNNYQKENEVEEIVDSTQKTPEVEIKLDRTRESPSFQINGSRDVVITSSGNQIEATEVEVEPTRTSETATLPSADVQSSGQTSPTKETEVQAPASQPLVPVFQPSKDHEELALSVKRYLVDKLTDIEMDRFLRETKIWYFLNMDLKGQDIRQILETILPSALQSSNDDISACAAHLLSDFEENTWGSDWFIDFVNSEVSTFNTKMAGFMHHGNRPKALRLDWWSDKARWNTTTFTRTFSWLDDTIDLPKIWSTKHWHDFTRKAFCAACDATWEHDNVSTTTNGENGGNGEVYMDTAGIYRGIRQALNERYPERSGSVWEVPRCRQAYTVPDSRKASIVSTMTMTRQNSAGGYGGADKRREEEREARANSVVVPETQQNGTGTPVNGHSV
ncbi:hypothetical protein ACLMJK_009294 [Lecanora helva]